MTGDQMMQIAKEAGYKDPMRRLDPETLRVHNYDGNDVCFIRFIEGCAYVYKFKCEIEMRPGD